MIKPKVPPAARDTGALRPFPQALVEGVKALFTTVRTPIKVTPKKRNMVLFTGFFVVFLALFGVSIALPLTRDTSPPVVIDLDYTLQQGRYNTNPYSSPFYSFSNIQFASAPRFSLPTFPPPTNRSLQTGSQAISCAASWPTWNNAVSQYDNGQTPVWTNGTYAGTSAPGPSSPEECLYLDLLVPAAVYQNAQNQSQTGSGVPVLVYIHGGGFVAGDKAGDNAVSDAANPGFEGQGYMARSNGSMIFISINYRLGIFGWLAGQSYAQGGGKTNLGLWDQRAALQWVQTYVSRFGGDPGRVTIVGESAGAGSIMHQFVAFGGKSAGEEGRLFQRAVPESPWHQPLTRQVQERWYQYTLEMANVSTFEELKGLSYESLFRVNTVVGANQYPFGMFNFGPVVDGDLVPGYYNDLLNNGSFDRAVEVLVGHTENEGFIFADVFIDDEQGYLGWLETVLSNASKTTLSNIANTLYPPNFDGSQGYTNWHGRMARTIGDMSGTCNSALLPSVFGKYNGANSSYAYQFSVPPGYHGEDIGYTMYKDGISNVNVTLAKRFQGYIVNFVTTGDPNGPGLPEFPTWSEGKTANFNVSGATEVLADNGGARCDFWSAGKYRS